MSPSRIAIIGPQSTGKSVLAESLAKHFGTTWVPEFARGYAEGKGAQLDISDVEKIAEGHLASEAAMALRAKDYLFVDTDIIMTLLYSQIYYGQIPAKVKSLCETKRYELTLVTTPDVPWIDDPQRDILNRDDFFDRCIHEVKVYKRSFAIIRGNWKDRFESAVRLVEGLGTK